MNNILKTIGKGYNSAIENTSVAFRYLIGLTIFEGVILYYVNIYMICLSAFLWTAFFLILYVTITWFTSLVENIRAVDGRTISEIEEILKSIPDKVIFYFLLGCINFTNTIAGLIISLTQLITNLHFERLTQVFAPNASYEKVPYLNILLIFFSPIIGFFLDITRNKIEKVSAKTKANKIINQYKVQTSEVMQILGVIAFSLIYIKLLTGFSGNEPALWAIQTLTESPYFLFDEFFMNEPSQMLTYIIYNGIGKFSFIFLYLLIPFSALVWSRNYIVKNGINNFWDIRKLEIFVGQIVALFILLIGLTVLVKEGWIGKLIRQFID